jgi:hypothetical protein
MAIARNPWRLTNAMTGGKISSGGHTYWEHKTTGLWWSSDTAGHGGCAFKVYRMLGRKLVWFRDADQYGDFINPNFKHKGPKGRTIIIQIEEDDEDDSFGERVR